MLDSQRFSFVERRDAFGAVDAVPQLPLTLIYRNSCPNWLFHACAIGVRVEPIGRRTIIAGTHEFLLGVRCLALPFTNEV